MSRTRVYCNGRPRPLPAGSPLLASISHHRDLISSRIRRGILPAAFGCSIKSWKRSPAAPRNTRSISSCALIRPAIVTLSIFLSRVSLGRRVPRITSCSGVFPWAFLALTSARRLSRNCPTLTCRRFRAMMCRTVLPSLSVVVILAPCDIRRLSRAVLIGSPSTDRRANTCSTVWP